jgi:HEAT repeat protein
MCLRLAVLACFWFIAVSTQSVLHGSAGQTPPKPTVPARPGTIPPDEAIALTQGWAFLAEGHLERAAARAADVLNVYPRSIGALVLAVEAEIARSGAPAGLAQYERWLGSRALEEPAVVRRIAVALLQETVGDGQADAARLEALRALAHDGDRAAVAELTSAVNANSPAETRLMAAMGDARSVKSLIALLDANAGNAMSIIDALAQSGSKAAVAPLVQRLQHPSPEIRGAAAEGLGKLGKRYDTVAPLQAALKDQSSYVRTRAAAALFQLGDMSGLTLLRGLFQEESAKSRLIAAQAMASSPDGLWMDQVRRLTSAAEPEVRVGAARLLLPHDPELARQILERGMSDPNPAIRDLASAGLGEAAAGDLRMLRHFLKLSDRLARVRAAARLLALTR